MTQNAPNLIRRFRCYARAIKNVRFLKQHNPATFARDKSALAFGTGVPFDILQVPHQLKPEFPEFTRRQDTPMLGNRKLVFGVIVFVAVGAVLVVLARFAWPHVVRAQTARGGPIHGYVGASLVNEAGATVVIQGRVINLPDISVFAKNLRTGVSSAPVKTNPQGYFRTNALAPGVYHICVEGTGYSSSCDPQEIEIVNSIHVMDHTVAIRPAGGAIDGTVRLADQVTPCFWFRPAFSTQTVIVAKVSLLDTGGNVVAGPVNGNSAGQYVLPLLGSQGGGFTLRAVCEGLASDVEVKFPGEGILQRDITIRNNAPQIVSVSLTKGGVGVRIADPGDTLQATVVATDLDGDTLHYKWTDDSGRSLGLPDAPTVNWPLLNSAALNTLRVQVSDGKGGYAVSQQSVRAGDKGILFQGTLVGRANGSAIGNATITLNGVSATSDSRGQFQVQVPNAPRFVLNISKPGFAFVSRVYYAQATALQIPLDATQTATVNGRTGGPVQMQPGECECACEDHQGWGKDHERGDRHHGDHDQDDRHHRHDHDRGTNCKQTTGRLAMTLAPNSLVDAQGKAFTGKAKVELFQYDTSLPNPIPGDQGALSQGKMVRLSTFGAFYIQPRDSAGQPLQMAPNKKAKITMPIEPALLAKAPATVPFLRYDESTGLWTEVGTLARSGNNYVGTINHFSVFNADTEFAGSACVKVILDPDTFTAFPYALDATYVDPSSGQFNHNFTQVTANPIGVERMTPNVNFTLNVYETNNTTLLKSVTLNSGPPLPAAFSGTGSNAGLDIDSVNYSHCNGPVTIYNNPSVPTGDLTYLMPIFSGTGEFQDNSTAYRAATQAATSADPKFTFPGWLAANGFPGTDSHAIYFNNGDLKFGRDMHCRVTNAGTTACYVSNYGHVGENDSATALSDARSGTALQATVAMEYNPSPTTAGEGVQFWAYDSGGNYLPRPTLDNQGAKPIPNMCQGCHGGYFDPATGLANGSIFLPFDLDSFLYDTQGDPHSAVNPGGYLAVQEQFRQLNNIVLNTNPDGQTGDNNKPVTQLMNLWYPGGVQNSGQQFLFNNAIAANQGGFPSNGPLYDNVVKPTCRTCHVAQGQIFDWTSFSQMSGQKGQIQSYACGGGSPQAHDTRNFAMPHAQVPFLLFWQNSLSTTLDSELSLASPGCPNQ